MTSMATPASRNADNSTEHVPMISYKHQEGRTASEDDNDGENEEREKWGKKLDYILSMVGVCVGLGNLWRFPYVCVRNGGGAFLIPFFVCLVLCGMPVYFLELALGQFVSRSPLHVWNICPLFKGMGLAMNILLQIGSCYYCMIIAWVLIYLANCFKSPLPWTLCGQSWNTPNCFTRRADTDQRGNISWAHNTFGNRTWETGNGMNGNNVFSNTSVIKNGDERIWNSTVDVDNGTWISGINGNRSDVLLNSSVVLKKIVAAEEFWNYNVLEISDGIEHIGGLPWSSALALFIACVCMLIGIIKGIRSSGKVVYVTATLPYILVSVLLVKGATLPGAAEGVLFYIKPDFSKLLLLQTWVEASIQVFYSLGVSWGLLITMASYNKFNNNCLRDAVLLTFFCEGTSVFGGFAIFTFLGHMSYTANIPIANFTSSGPGLAFVVYPEAISYLPLPQVWGVLFFLMLFSLGLDTLFATAETALTGIVDAWPQVLRRWRTSLSASYITIFFLLCLPYATRGGIYLFQLTDWFVAAVTNFLLAILENIVVSWIYGIQNFRRDIEMMIGRLPPFFFVVMWTVVTPAVLVLTLVCTLITYTAPKYGDYVFGPWSNALGWFIAIVSFIPVPVFAVRQLYLGRGTLVQRMKQACRPADTWGPADLKHRESYKLAMAEEHSFPRGPCV